MAATPSYALQRQSIEHVIALLESRAADREGLTVAESVVVALKAAALSVGTLERYREVTNALVKLQRDAPDLMAMLQIVLTTFPGSTIAGVNNGDRDFDRAGERGDWDAGEPGSDNDPGDHLRL